MQSRSRDRQGVEHSNGLIVEQVESFPEQGRAASGQ
jgi:hypothetical protein